MLSVEESFQEDAMNSNEELTSDGIVGTLDGVGAGDHDQPYRFGWRPRASVPYPFSTRQYARLLLLRSRVRDQPAWFEHRHVAA
jgi:hypothetical protein